MTKLHAGTVGWGVWLSGDLGESWDSAFRGLYTEGRIWALSAHDQVQVLPGRVLTWSDGTE